MDKAGAEVGVNFVGGFSALVHKGASAADNKLMDSIPQRAGRHRAACARASTSAPRAPASTWTPCARWAQVVKQTRRADTADQRLHRLRQARGVLPTPSRTTPSWPARSTARARPTAVINVGVSGPGVVQAARWQDVPKGAPFDVVAETIKAHRVPDHPHRPAGGAARRRRRLRRALWHRRPVAGADPGRGRLRGRDPGGHGRWRPAAAHGTTAALAHAQRRGEEGRRHGLVATWAACPARSSPSARTPA